jgi:hypothetical protein
MHKDHVTQALIRSSCLLDYKLKRKRFPHPDFEIRQQCNIEQADFVIIGSNPNSSSGLSSMRITIVFRARKS